MDDEIFSWSELEDPPLTDVHHRYLEELDGMLREHDVERREKCRRRMRALTALMRLDKPI